MGDWIKAAGWLIVVAILVVPVGCGLWMDQHPDIMGIINLAVSGAFVAAIVFVIFLVVSCFSPNKRP